MRKHDVIQKTGNTQHVATPPEETRATGIGNMHAKNLAKMGHVVLEIWRQPHRQTYSVDITILRRERSIFIDRHCCCRLAMSNGRQRSDVAEPQIPTSRSARTANATRTQVSPFLKGSLLRCIGLLAVHRSRIKNV